MEKKSSIRTIGIFFILLGLMRLIWFSFLFYFHLRLISPKESFFQTFSMLMQQAVGATFSQFIASIFINIGYLICGIAILYLMNWARKLLIGLLSLKTIISLTNLILFIQKRTLTVQIFIEFIFAIFFVIFLIYLLTRSKVKEQFK